MYVVIIVILMAIHVVSVQMPAITIGRKFVHSMKRGDDALHVQQVLAANVILFKI